MDLVPNWLKNIVLPTEHPGVASSLVAIFMVMAIGILIGKLKVKKISLGISGVMFAGILSGHLGYRLDEHVIEFLRDMGLILFVYAVGMQVGPSFFSSFKKDGLRYNALAIGTVLGGGAITLLIFFLTNIGMDNLVGMMSGAVTNTPGLGAAKASLGEISGRVPYKIFSDPANAYAITYPFGVLGLIIVMVLSKYLFKININEEVKAFEEGIRRDHPTPRVVKCRITNPSFYNKTINEFNRLIHNKVIVSRIKHSGSLAVESPHQSDFLCERDVSCRTEGQL